MAPSPSFVLPDVDEEFSLHSLFERSVEKYADKPCMALSRYTSYPPKQRNVEPKFDPIYEYQTYKQVGDLVNNIAASLIALNLEKTPCDEGEEPRVKVGFWCSTSFEMRVAMMACHKAGFVIVPVYETLSHENVFSMFELTEISLIFADSKSHYLDSVKFAETHTNVKYLIKLDFNQDLLDCIEMPKYSENTIEFNKLSKFEGEIKNVEYPKVSKSDLAFIFSTSGSTGAAKGVAQTHDSIACIVIAASHSFEGIAKKLYLEGKQFTSYSFLSLAHIYGQIVDFICYVFGARIAYPSGFVRTTLLSDLNIVKPHLITIVPLVLKRVYDNVQSRLAKNILMRSLFNLALKFKDITGFSLLDIAFKNIRKAVGGELAIIFSGGAPLSEELYKFAKNCLGVTVVQGYGLTEGILSLQNYSVSKGCNIGFKLKFNEYKLVDEEDLGYFVANNQGELCVKGRSVFKGYYKSPELTEAAFDSEGFFKTGDIVEEITDNKNKAFKYLDRLKNIFKLAHGEYVAPEEVETLYLKAGICEQIFVYGDSHRSYCVAIGFINPMRVKELLKLIEPGFDSSTLPGLDELDGLDSLIANYRDKISKLMNKQVVELPSYKRAKNWYFTTYLLTQENELLTPTMKQKRHMIAKHFATQITKMCKETDALYIKTKK